MTSRRQGNYIAISGGVGGAKLALGLSRVLAPDQLTIVANTGDDFDHLGFFISPDIDTVMYTLADLSNKELGWGLAGESWQFLEALERLGGEAWFRLGDRDLATHVMRTALLRQGATLSAATGQLCSALGIAHPVVPMSDDPVPTVVHTKDGDLGFQHYFVRDHCEPEVTGFEFKGIEAAHPAPAFADALAADELSAVIVCPSNPFVSVDPVLHLPGVMDAIHRARVPMIAVSPIVGGRAIKGPAAKMMAELGMPQTALAVAEHYVGRVDGFVLDDEDAGLESAVQDLGMETLVTNTIMTTLDDRVALAECTLDFARRIGTGNTK
ncbi:MAG TPA: 2-phospho-L-lactate transferase [Pseudomonadales bacterium]|nr:2-phospho-L-lactate transferase [Pseudomonadales bacterium]